MTSDMDSPRSLSGTYEMRLPVLITAFSRYETTRQVIEAVRKVKPPRLYFSCDGPRNEAERVVCDRVRSLVELVDWDCELHTLFHEQNLGCRSSMITGISWFFEKEEEGVILEDDIVPDPTFFQFAQELLEKYRDDERIWAIVGNNLSAQAPIAHPDSYWLSAHGYGAYWGWASWRRSWKKFDEKLVKWPEVQRSGSFDKYYLSEAEKHEASMFFSMIHTGEMITAWDYQFDFAKILAGAANIIPEANLCLNIGFGEGGTHTVNTSDNRNRTELHQARFPLKHPEPLELDHQRDLAYFEAFILPSPWQRIKNKVKVLLPDSWEEKLVPLLRIIRGAKN